MDEAKKLFNSHPDLTLFARDEASFEIAKNHFDGCKVHLASDMAFFLSGIGNPGQRQPEKDVLYLSRQDLELDSRFYAPKLDMEELPVEDWVVMNSISRQMQRLVRIFPWLWPIFCSKMFWPIRKSDTRGRPDPILDDLVKNPYRTFHGRSVYMAKLAMTQIQNYRVVITNRLHGHVFSTLLGIPNILLSNAYHKNEAFFKSWTQNVPFARFVQQPTEVAQTVQELLGNYSPLK